MLRSRLPQAGFTLMEVLIALTISGLLLALLSQAFFMVTRQWESRFDLQYRAIEEARLQMLVEQSLARMVAYIPPDEAAQRLRTPLFDGSTQSMTWVTAAPLVTEGMAMASLKIGDVEGESFWVYQESPVIDTSEPASGVSTEVSKEKSTQLVLWPAAGQVIRYLGYSTLEQRLEEEQQGPEWVEVYSATRSRQLPRAVQIYVAETGRLITAVTVRNTDLRYLQAAE